MADMFEELTKRLNDLILPLDFITEQAAGKLISLTARAITNEIGKENVDIYLLDVLWKNKEENNDGGRKKIEFCLSPLIPGNDYTSEKRRGPAKRKILKINNEVIENNGIWNLAYRNKEDIWIENIQSKDYFTSNDPEGRMEDLEQGYIMLKQPVKNEASVKKLKQIDSIKDLVIFRDTNSIICIPLIHINRYYDEDNGIPVGLFSIEARRGVFDRHIYNGLKEKVTPLIANLIWRLDVDRYVKKETEEAINIFEDFVYKFEKTTEKSKGDSKNIDIDDAEENKRTSKIFLGHGRSSVWKEFKDFITDRLKLPYDEFNRESPAGYTNTERLSTMLNEARFAFLIMTAEDEHADTTLHARENVIHEVGLFQGHLGIRKAIILLEDGCKEFSNTFGLSPIRFSKQHIPAVFDEMRRVLEREGIL